MKPDILVVDDDHAIREAVRLILHEEGYSVVEASNGQTALRVLRDTSHPLVVLLDQFMPMLDGAGVLRAVASDPLLRGRRHEFILVTGSASMVGAGAECEFGPPLAGIIAKPFDLDALLEIVARAMDRTRGAVLPRWDSDTGSQLDSMN